MIIVTGGAGFIGSCLVKKLNDNGINDVVIVDNLGSTDKWKNLNGKVFEDYVDKNDFLDMFITMTKLMDVEIDDVDAIVHLGACSETTMQDASYLMKNNYAYSKSLAEIALDKGIRFIYASSASTYGDGSKGYSDQDNAEFKPLNPYGFSKYAFDMWVKENMIDSEVLGLRFFNVFGPNEYHKGSMSSMVYKSYNQIKETGKVKLFKSNHPDYKDGEQKRDFVYVKDCVDIIYDAINKPKLNGIVNVGTGKAHSWNELTSAVFSAMKKHPIVEYVDMPGNLANQYQNFTQADIALFKKKFPKFRFHSLEDSVNDYVQNHLMSDDIYY